MTTYTIGTESNQITTYMSEKEGEVITAAERFRSEADLANLAASWPMARLIKIWSNLPGVNPVKKFQDRKTAIARIWRALNTAAVSARAQAQPEIEEAPVTETAQAVETEPERGQQPAFAPEAALPPGAPSGNAPSTASTTRRKKSTTASANASGSRQGSKTALVLELMQRESGATAQELLSITGCQAHSLRGFISGTLGKKMGLTVMSSKAENGARTYSISK